VVQARVVASSGSVDERVRVEAGFHGQRGRGEAVEVRQGDTPALAELTDVPDWYMESQASARLVGEHGRVGAAVPGQVADALLDEPREDNLVEGIARFGPGVARRLIWRTSSATTARQW
jgi:hypothetical protein